MSLAAIADEDDVFLRSQERDKSLKDGECFRGSYLVLHRLVEDGIQILAHLRSPEKKGNFGGKWLAYNGERHNEDHTVKSNTDRSYINAAMEASTEYGTRSVYTPKRKVDVPIVLVGEPEKLDLLVKVKNVQVPWGMENQRIFGFSWDGELPNAEDLDNREIIKVKWHPLLKITIGPKEDSKKSAVIIPANDPDVQRDIYNAIREKLNHTYSSKVLS